MALNRHDLPESIRRHYPFESRFAAVGGHQLHYVDEGAGDPVVLLHGNPTWSFLYRRIIPPLVAAGHRVLAPDHIGFGLSDKPAREHDYSLENHIANLTAWIDQLGLTNVTIVGQDWGGPIGLSYAMTHPGNVKALVVMNTWAWPTPSDFHAAIRPWRMMHAPVVGPYLFQRRNILVERGLYLSVVDRRRFAAEALEAYRWALPDYDSRILTLAFPRTIPLGEGDRAYATLRWLEDAVGRSELPALIIWGKEEIVFPGSFAERFKRLIPHARGPYWVTGSHFLQEDSPTEIASYIGAFLDDLRGGAAR